MTNIMMSEKDEGDHLADHFNMVMSNKIHSNGVSSKPTVFAFDIEEQPTSTEPKSSSHQASSQSETTSKPRDLYQLPDWEESDSPKWKDLSSQKKVIHVILLVLKVLGLILLLYLFVCSLSFLSSALRLLGGKAAGEIFQDNEVLKNPIAGLMIGVLATVLVQSSSTSTSIIVSMVNAGILEVRQAIYIVMGANIGTSVTNTIVSLFHGADRNHFRRAFAAATVHDIFNFLSVSILLPLEFGTRQAFGQGYLEWLSGSIVSGIGSSNESLTEDVEILNKITKPFTSLVVQLDSKVIHAVAEGADTTNKTIAKHWCKKEGVQTWCKYLLNLDKPDSLIGAILLIVSLFILCTCLILIVKTLNVLLRGSVAKVLRKTVNANFKRPFGWLTGYLAICVGVILTFLVQSSSIFTSTLTPLVAVGVLSLDRCYPLTLGSNIGTTGTAIIASLATEDFKHSLQIALCHLFFNVTGILIWYPVPVLRAVPIRLAQGLGNVTAKYRWFAVLYLILIFFLVPVVIFALSVAGWQYLIAVGVPAVVLIIAISVLNCLQAKCPDKLPAKLRNWDWLPAPLKMETYDRVFVRIYQMTCGRCKRASKSCRSKQTTSESS